jgi:hypothetical protein
MFYVLLFLEFFITFNPNETWNRPWMNLAMLANLQCYLEVNVYDICKPTVHLSALWPIRSTLLPILCSECHESRWKLETLHSDKGITQCRPTCTVIELANSRGSLAVQEVANQCPEFPEYRIAEGDIIEQSVRHIGIGPYLFTSFTLLHSFTVNIYHCFDTNTWNSGSSMATKTSRRMMLSTCQVVLLPVWSPPANVTGLPITALPELHTSPTPTVGKGPKFRAPVCTQHSCWALVGHSRRWMGGSAAFPK